MLHVDEEALAGYRDLFVNPEPREAEFIAAGEDGVSFRFSSMVSFWRKAAAREVLSASLLWWRTTGRFPSLRYPSREERGLPGPLRSTKSPPGTAGKLSPPFRKKAFIAKQGISELPSSGLFHKVQTSFTKYPGKRLGISSSRGCPIRHRFLSRRTL